MIKITEKEFRQIADYIKANYGIQLKEEKMALVTGRLHGILTQHDFKSFTEYFEYILRDKTGEAAIELMNKITTNHTFFMREPEHFNYFRDKVLPYLSQEVRSRDLRVWSAGCSTGEEPYTLAMIIDEYFGADKRNWDTKILATDISLKALDAAKQGVYSKREIEPVPPLWKSSYFTPVDAETSAVSDKIKNEVIFRRFNLMNQSFAFKKKFHVIFCRNVMIYFNNDTKHELVGRFYDATEEGGYLFIGHAESLNREQTKYKFIMPAVYRKE
ncbi:chemotaxis protein methyltransferase CheR [Sporobacter termitidis DSM 10068]|uniref:protein-glutamate O-methyltransferase n=1 Tax=Sporobacter termitidis DSM 10068 TaxID=1123282 RepID=A0A1M5WAJ2_9FIRM|nr:protein-glutamate O-methyltransferase CheR [Sporobacter termitidis]SHH84233.1 chemotaxis protein methyltransferase CheR [Sporobacter termitidis DSM 10068]